MSLLIISSCQYFDAKAPNEKELLEAELKKINWEEVDQYPSIFQCDSINDKELQKQCFFNNLTFTIQERIGVDTLQILFPSIDTLSVKVTVNSDASLKFEGQRTKGSINYDLRKIDSILQNRLSDFPEVEPAIKRGIKVKTQFVVPIIIRNIE